MIIRIDRAFGTLGVATGDWPILLIEFPEKRVTHDDLRAALDHVESLLRQAVKNREKTFIVTDLTAMRELAPANQRQFTAQWMKRTGSLLKLASAGVATVTPSPILRGIITALYWLQPPPIPAFSVATRDEAMLLGIARLEEEGALLPPRLFAYRDKHSARIRRPD